MDKVIIRGVEIVENDFDSSEGRKKIMSVLKFLDVYTPNGNAISDSISNLEQWIAKVQTRVDNLDHESGSTKIMK